MPRDDIIRLHDPSTTLAASLGDAAYDWEPVPYEPTGGVQYVSDTRNPLGLGAAAGEATRMLRDAQEQPLLYGIPDYDYFANQSGYTSPLLAAPTTFGSMGDWAGSALVPDDFATDVLTGIGAPVTEENLATVALWQHMEGTADQGRGMTGAGAENNPLATTWGRSQGYDPYNYDAEGDPLVWNYPDYATGVQNTINTLNLGYYDPLVQGLQQNLDAATLNMMPGVQDALASWSGGHYNEFGNAGIPGWAAGMNPADVSSADALAEALAASVFG